MTELMLFVIARDEIGKSRIFFKYTGSMTCQNLSGLVVDLFPLFGRAPIVDHLTVERNQVVGFISF